MANSNRKICKTLPKQSFDYHSRKCVICRHPDRAAIEEEFVHWGGVWDIARIHHLGDYRSVYRHAHATGLTLRRRENLHSVLDIFLEKARGARMSGDSILRAIRAYSCVDSLGRWVDPPTQMNYSIVQSGAQTGAPAVTPAPHFIAPARAASAEPAHAANSTSQRSTVIDLDLDETDEGIEVDENDEPDVNVVDDETVEADETDETVESDETDEADENDVVNENEDIVEGQDTDENDHEPCADGESALENVAVPEADGESASKTDSALETDGKAALEYVAVPNADGESALEADGESVPENDPVPALKTYPVAKSKPVPQPAPVPSPALARNTSREPAPSLTMTPALKMNAAIAPMTAQTQPPFHPAVTNPTPTYGVMTDAGQINGGAIRMACIPLKTNNGDPFKSTVKTTFRPAHFARRHRRRK